MTGKRGQRSKKGRTVPAKYKPGFLQKMDRRSTVARTLESRKAQLVADQGGPERMSFLRSSLTEQAIWLDGMLRAMVQKMLDGEHLDEGKYRGHLNTLIGIARTLGIDRVAARVPRALDYAAQVGAEEAQ